MVTDAAEATRARILDAAEALLQRLGPGKLGVVDVARALGMSHANVYRHFASKAALRDAVAARWLEAVAAPLTVIAEATGPADARLMEWLRTLIAIKRRKVLADPEMFETYHLLAEQSRAVVEEHVGALLAQLARMVSDGVAQGVFAPCDVRAASGAVLDATMRFHHPHFLRDPLMRADEAQAEPAIRLVLAGLRAGAGGGAG